MSKEDRTKTMKAIRSQSKLENRFTRALWHRGLRFRKNVRSLFGKPDISIQKYKIAIFIDSCFWHVCPIHSNKPQTNPEFWEKKLLRNQQRDKEVNKYYQQNGWHVKRIWEHDIKKDFNGAIEEVLHFINTVKELDAAAKKDY
jgi:DNA mismatch endonuclease, patch repair protein